VRALQVAPATEIDAGGCKLAHRDTLKLTALRGPDAEVR
jgi:hypothetical protein